MANNIKTVFQRLDQAITGNWDASGGNMGHSNSYDLSSYNGGGNDVLYTTTDRASYETKKLELQQNAYLNQRWLKANHDMSVQAFNGLNNIKLMYRDADLMDSFPEIGAALDILAEESCITNSKGQVINVYSKSDRIKSILEDLFTNRLDMQVMAPMIMRGMCKYGNQFMLLNVELNSGVKGWKQLPVFFMERLENGVENPYSSQAAINAANKANEVDMSTKFVWMDEKAGQVPFRNWQIAHFRLLTDSIYLPYGSSYLNKARRHWRMLSLMEDMMLIYRLERSIERRVYKIYVGAIDDADVSAYVQDIANNFKRTPIIDPLTGQIDLRKNILPVRKDTPIPLLDGRTITIEELAKEYEEGKTNYVYSIQDKTLDLVPGKVVWCGKNYTAEQLVKITLDDDTYVVMAPEHEFIMRDGTKKRADELIVGESVMPFYREKDEKSVNFYERYEKVYNPSTGKYVRTHRMVAKQLEKQDPSFNTVHHIDFNKYNNTPENLLWCDFNEHHKMHGNLAKSIWADPIKRQQIIEKLSHHAKGRIITDEVKEKISSTLKTKYQNGYLEQARESSRCNIIAYNKSEKHREGARQRGRKLGYIDSFKNYNESDLHKEHDAIRRVASRESWEGDLRGVRERKMSCQFDDVIWNWIEEEIVSGKVYSRNTLLNFLNSPHVIEHLKTINSDNTKFLNTSKVTRPILEVRIKLKGFSCINDYMMDICNRRSVEENAKRIIINNSIKAERNKEKSLNSFSDDVWNSLRKGVLSGEITNFPTLASYFENNCSLLMDNSFKLNRIVFDRLIRLKGFKNLGDYILSMRKNHKIKAIEYIGGDDVYCMTVMGLNGEDDRHNFAMRSFNQDGSWCENGVFVSNCQDTDIFIPTRDPNAPTPIDTLPAAQNLTAMDDIKFVQNKLLTALGIPRSFLNFDDATGDGKNLALMDIRFTRRVNRIQQAFLMEMTKVASIHLYLLGFEDDLTNFSLSMNNPSTQAEGLEIDNIQKKISVVRDAVSDPGNGIPVMSLTRALKEVMKWSDKDIQNNLEEIRLEKALAAELEKTTQIIKKTGIFDTVDNMYGEPGAEYQEDMQQGQGEDPMGGGGGFGGGGGMPSFDEPTDGGVDELGNLGAEEEGEIAGQEGEMPMGEQPPQGDMNSTETPMESTKRKKPLLTETKSLDKFFIDRFAQRNEIKVERSEIYDKTLLINEEFDSLIKSMENIKNENK